MRLYEVVQSGKMAGSQLQMVLFHGSTSAITKFRKNPQGIFFSPHREWAENYGNIITSAYVWAPKVYLVDDSEFGEQVLDALFDRDYDSLAGYIKELQSAGYYALQTQTDSEMVCAFPNSRIYSAETGEEM